MRTPAVMIIGIVFAPCGLVLDLVCTVAPGWRDVSNINNGKADEVHHQGIWDICQEFQTTHKTTCGFTDGTYFQTLVIQAARGLMLASLGVTAVGIIIASLGIRCWRSRPNYLFAGIGGVVIFISGVISLIPQSWYTSQIQTITATGTTIQASYALVIGFIGSFFEIIGGFSLILSFTHFCNQRQKSSTSKYVSNPKTSTVKRAPISYTNPLGVTDVISVASSPLPCDSEL